MVGFAMLADFRVKSKEREKRQVHRAYQRKKKLVTVIGKRKKT